MSNVNDIYFKGHYKEIWKQTIPDILNEREMNFIFSYFGLESGARVLDLMCGYGRHTIALARKGMQVTAVDNLAEYIEEINKTATAEKLPISTINENLVNYKADGEFDLAICMGNSLNFFNEADTLKILKEVGAHLRPDGHLLINTWSLTEIVFNKFSGNSWSIFGDKKFLNASKIAYQPTRLESTTTIICADGSVEELNGVDYLYSINEMDKMLTAAGLSLKEVYSIPGKKLFTAGEPRAYIIVTREK